MPLKAKPSSGSSTDQAESSRVSIAERAQNTLKFNHQAEKLSLQQPNDTSPVVVGAHFVTPQDPVLITSDGNRLPGVPLREAHKLNVLREELDGRPETVVIKEGDETKEEISNTDDPNNKHVKVIDLPKQPDKASRKLGADTLQHAMPPSHTNPLFPPLPLYGPPSILRNFQCVLFRISSFFLSLAFLGAIVVASLATSVPIVCKKILYRLTFRNLAATRPFYDEEMRRQAVRQEQDKAWKKKTTSQALGPDEEGTANEFPPTEGGSDPVVCDVGYYARRVGLDIEELKVETEDGFIIDLWHVYDPKEYTEISVEAGEKRASGDFRQSNRKLKAPEKKRKFPVLLMHGLLQSSGAYCCNDDESLAFWLCKSGYDVWLGNNRCGFEPQHKLLKYKDPRLWAWNIRQMGVFDLPALTSRAIEETGFAKIGLICHSQGTTQTFVALAKEQRPDLGEKLTVFCALAPAAYAGPLIGKMYFRFMRIISPALFRLMFGIHAFIPFMMRMHAILNPQLYGWLGYKVFSYLFDWTDERWDRGLKSRMFQFAPVYVSAESMRWWLGRECFAKHKCILATKDCLREEERVDQEEEKLKRDESTESNPYRRGETAWYNSQAPPFALWVCGNDDLVDGRRLLRRFETGREPHVEVVHSKVIEEYEHLDVIWAMDAVEQVFKEVREVLWKTCDVRDVCRVPKGCEHVQMWKSQRENQDDGGESSGCEE